MSGLWKSDPKTPGGKFLVTRRDGTVPEWPYFVLGGRDPAAPAALLAYAAEAERRGYDPQYVYDVRVLAEVFARCRAVLGDGNPTAAPHRTDDPATIAKMKSGKGA